VLEQSGSSERDLEQVSDLLDLGVQPSHSGIRIIRSRFWKCRDTFLSMASDEDRKICYTFELTVDWPGLVACMSSVSKTT
jgi:hypothetical protein